MHARTQLHDYRMEFNKWWRQEMKQVKFPDAGTIFDYCIDYATNRFVPWVVPQYVHQVWGSGHTEREEGRRYRSVKSAALLCTVLSALNPLLLASTDQHVCFAVPARVVLVRVASQPEKPVPTVLVPTVETTRLMYWMTALMNNRRPVLLLGGAGCGKTMIVKERLANLGSQYMYANINYNYYTDAKNLQFIMEQPLIKIGKQFAPPGNKRLV